MSQGVAGREGPPSFPLDTERAECTDDNDHFDRVAVRDLSSSRVRDRTIGCPFDGDVSPAFHCVPCSPDGVVWSRNRRLSLC